MFLSELSFNELAIRDVQRNIEKYIKYHTFIVVNNSDALKKVQDPECRS